MSLHRVSSLSIPVSDSSLYRLLPGLDLPVISMLQIYDTQVSKSQRGHLGTILNAYHVRVARPPGNFPITVIQDDLLEWGPPVPALSLRAGVEHEQIPTYDNEQLQL